MLGGVGFAANKSRKDDGQPTLSEWLNKKLTRKHTTLLYYPTNLCGPDLVFSLYRRNEVVAFVLVQVKSGQNFDLEHAKITVDPIKLYHGRKGECTLSELNKKEFISSSLALQDIPVIRMVWSKQTIKKSVSVQSVMRGNVKDLEVVLDSSIGFAQPASKRAKME